jgi:DNA-damage-inducible protein D
MVQIGSGTEREIEDIALSRYACYLVGQNGDSRKQEIRNGLLERSIWAEELPPAEDVKKVQRKLEKEEKKMLKDIMQGKDDKKDD